MKKNSVFIPLGRVSLIPFRLTLFSFFGGSFHFSRLPIRLCVLDFGLSVGFGKIEVVGKVPTEKGSKNGRVLRKAR
jgi:hypothetical protein